MEHISLKQTNTLEQTLKTEHKENAYLKHKNLLRLSRLGHLTQNF